jgi:hypothetical protein
MIVDASDELIDGLGEVIMTTMNTTVTASKTKRIYTFMLI